MPMNIKNEIRAATSSASSLFAYVTIAVTVAFWGCLSLAFLGLAVEASVAAGGFGILLFGLWAWVSYPLLTIGRWLFSWESMLERECDVIWISDLKTDFTGQDDLLCERLGRIAKTVGLAKTPKLGVNQNTNAFAFSYNKDKGVVVLGKPLIEAMSNDELDAVMAHEVAHIASQDALTSSAILIVRSSISSIVRPITVVLGFLGLTFSGAGLLSRDGDSGLVMMLVGLALFLSLIPLWIFYWVSEYGSRLIESGHSRRREYKADRVGALATSPDGMISALKRLNGWGDGKNSAGPEALQAFNIITHSASGGQAGLLATHPPVSRRIAELERLKAQIG